MLTLLPIILADNISGSEFCNVIPLNQSGNNVDTVTSQIENTIKTSIDCTFIIRGNKNLGTGFFISSNGFAITCKHVLENDQNHVAILNDRSRCHIGIISINEKYDLALIMVIVNKETPYLSIRDPFTMTPGDRVFAIGTSLGLQATISEGVFAGLRENTSTRDNIIQFSASINPGNSGGPLVDEKGELIGVVSWKIVSQNRMPVTGVEFAVPSSYIVNEYGHYLE